MGACRTEKPIMAMKCMVQMPVPIEVAPRASQPALKLSRWRSDLVVHRRPRAPPRHAMRKAATGVTSP